MSVGIRLNVAARIPEMDLCHTPHALLKHRHIGPGKQAESKTMCTIVPGVMQPHHRDRCSWPKKRKIKGVLKRVLNLVKLQCQGHVSQTLPFCVQQKAHNCAAAKFSATLILVHFESLPVRAMERGFPASLFSLLSRALPVLLPSTLALPALFR